MSLPLQAHTSVENLLYWQTFLMFCKRNISSVVVKQTLVCDPNVPVNVFSDYGVQMFTNHLGRKTEVTCFRNSCLGKKKTPVLPSAARMSLRRCPCVLLYSARWGRLSSETPAPVLALPLVPSVTMIVPLHPTVPQCLRLEK